jgi:hypothetical protein
MVGTKPTTYYRTLNDLRKVIVEKYTTFVKVIVLWNSIQQHGGSAKIFYAFRFKYGNKRTTGNRHVKLGIEKNHEHDYA